MDQIIYVDHPDKVPAVIPGPVLYLDVETYGVHPRTGLDLLTNQVRLVAMTGETGPAYVFDLYRVVLSDFRHLFNLDQQWCGHNLTFDLSSLHRLGIEYPSKIYDTLVCSQVLMNGLDPAIHGGNRLEECLERFCEYTLIKGHGEDDWSHPGLTRDQIEYAGNDVLCLRLLRPNLIDRLEKKDLTKIGNLESAIVPAIVDMTLNGIQVDVPHWLARSEEAERQVFETENELHALFPKPDPEEHKTVRRKKSGEPYASDLAFNRRVDEKNLIRQWNWASHIQVTDAFAKVGVFLEDTTYETLVARQDEHAGVALLLRFKDVEKEATTFGRDWLKHIRNEVGPNRVHPNWRQLGADSGRMSCAHPNLQQMPRPKRVRKGITASPGRVLVRADFSQIEARIAAKISGDQTLSNLFINKTGDIHRFTAGKVLGKTEAEVTADDRQIGKSLLFGLLFGMGWQNLLVYCRTNYGVTLTPLQAQEFRNRFFKVFPGLVRWHQFTGRTCEERNEFRSLLGRRRMVMDKTNKYTLALNHPVQATGADMLKASVREMWEERQLWPGANLCMLVHDELCYDVVEADAERFSVRLKEVMIEVGNTLLTPIPVDAEVKIGRTWGG